MSAAHGGEKVAPEYDGYAVQILTNPGLRSAYWAFDDQGPSTHPTLAEAAACAEEIVEAGYHEEHVRIVGLRPLTFASQGEHRNA